MIVPASYLLDDLDLAVETGGATLDQRDISGKAHLVDMTAGVKVVESVEDKVEALEPVDVELGVFDVGVVCLDIDVGVKLSSRLLCDLDERKAWLAMVRLLRGGGWRQTHQGLGLFNVFVPEQELAVEVGQVNGVEIHDVDVAEAGKHEVLEQLTSNAASADHEDARLRVWVSQGRRTAWRRIALV